MRAELEYIDTHSRADTDGTEDRPEDGDQDREAGSSVSPEQQSW